VGAEMSTFSRFAILGHASSCIPEGAPKAAENHSRMSG